MKKSKYAFIGSVVLFFLVSYVGLFLKNNSTDQEITEIRATKVLVPFNESILDSDIVVKVRIIDVDSEIRIDLPKTIHNAEIISAYKMQDGKIGRIKIMQDGTKDTLVNGMPIFKTGDYFIFMLNLAEPTTKFPNTYFIRREYLLSEDQNQVLDLNFGDSNLEHEEPVGDNKFIEKAHKIIRKMSVDVENLIITETDELVEFIEEVIENEEQ